jgi:two-component system sensor histidine kinase PilS (NtrC family)
MIVLALVVGTGIMIMQLSVPGFSATPLYVLLALSYVVGGVIYTGFRLGLKLSAAVWTLMVTDTAFETAIVHYSGGLASPFTLIFCLSIIAAAFLLQVPGGLGIALLATVSYVGYGVLQARGVLNPPMAPDTTEGVTAGFLQTYMHVSLFFVVGAVAGFLAERIHQKGHALHSAETQLEQLKVDTDNILKNMSSGVLVVDTEGRIITINPAARRILLIDSPSVGGVEDTGFQTMMPELGEEMLRALRSDKSKFRHEITVNRPDNTDLPLGISTSVLRDSKGEKRGVIAVFQDLTEVRDMQQRVRKADRLAAIGELSAGIAHEIRNPLASISGSIEMLANELKLKGEHKRLMELVTTESDRLDRIINDFLEFARLRPPSREKVALAGCLDDVVVLLNNNTTLSANIKSDGEPGTNDVVVRIDAEQMRQVFLNLAINGCEAMPDGGMLAIQTRVRRDGWLEIAFEDEGPGISKEARSRLFEPFFTTKDGGTGLGLAIANKIVEAHGGRIEVRNREKQGASVAVLLPANVTKEVRDQEEVETASRS